MILKNISQVSLGLEQSSIKSILFIGIIHRFNKAQQNILPPYIKDGAIVFLEPRQKKYHSKSTRRHCPDVEPFIIEN